VSEPIRCASCGWDALQPEDMAALRSENQQLRKEVERTQADLASTLGLIADLREEFCHRIMQFDDGDVMAAEYIDNWLSTLSTKETKR